MNAESMNLMKIFEPSIRYQVPLFQRPYVWNESDNWQPIWDDVSRLAERHLSEDEVPPHFLGAIVLDQLLSPTGSVETRQVIDGQQRLITLQLLMVALRDLACLHNEHRQLSRFAKLTANDKEQYDDPEEEFKVWPTNTDREDYRKTMHAGSPEALLAAYHAKPNQRRLGLLIPDAYLYFSEAVSDWLFRESQDDELLDPLPGSLGARFEALWTIMRKNVLLVVIDLEAKDDAQVIFETLNARGTRLSPADLVKNYLFHKASLEQASVNELYTKYWRWFDESFWRKEIRHGRLKRPLIDFFLQHYLALKTRDDVNVELIFRTFKQFVRAPAAGGSPPESQTFSAEWHIRQLFEYGKVYETFHSTGAGERAKLFFERLRAIETTTVFPFLLEAFKQLEQPGKQSRLNELLVYLESFVTRRMICGLTAKNYNRLFLDLVNHAEKNGEVGSAAVREFLLKQKGDSVRWPNDAELSQAWLSNEIYNRLTQTKLRMVLTALDSALETSKSEGVQLTGKLTIEHLMPQRWMKNWPLVLTDENNEQETKERMERRNRLLHTMGNLTLLTEQLNPAVSDRAWQDKRPEILKYSKLNLNRYFQDVEEWNEAKIEQRGNELFEIARRIWPYPAAV